MKKIGFLSIAALLVGAMVFTACGKYEEGPSVSLRTKKGRLAGEWMIEKYLENGTDQTSAMLTGISDHNFTFEKDGTFSTSMTTSFGTFTSSGTWQFITDKEQLETTTTTVNGTALSTPDKDTSTITRLTNKEFWTKDTYGSDTYEYHYMTK